MHIINIILLIVYVCRVATFTMYTTGTLETIRNAKSINMLESCVLWAQINISEKIRWPLNISQKLNFVIFFEWQYLKDGLSERNRILQNCMGYHRLAYDHYGKILCSTWDRLDCTPVCRAFSTLKKNLKFYKNLFDLVDHGTNDMGHLFCGHHKLACRRLLHN